MRRLLELVGYRDDRLLKPTRVASPSIHRQCAFRAIRESEGGGGLLRWALALLGRHTPSKNPRPVSRTQAYIA